MKKNLQDIIGTCIGGVTGWISQGIYNDWIQPILLSGICALLGLLITHYGKKLLTKWKL